ncbi:hypothetical protein ACOMHN_037690 [Nucella lapillus]
MEITKSNFTEKLDDVAEAISQASFLAIDGEFTGLDKPGYSHTNPFDTPQERYMKLRKGSLDFLLVQVGVCAFKFQEETQSYEARPFNFYVFPRPYTRQAPDRRFLCQSSSIEFLVQQGFDFNKLFYEGIPYLTPAQEDGLKECLNLKHQMFAKFSSPAFTSPVSGEGPGKGPIQIPEEQKEFVANTCDKVSKFIDDSTENVLSLPPCNGFQRKLTFQSIRAKFSSVHLETKTGEKKERFIVVTKVANDEELKKKEKDKQNAEIMELEEAVGFTKVMRLIAQSGKPVVGHNMMLDVMHLLNHFCFPLPQELEEFKAMVRSSLPRLFDTKHIASTHPFRDLIPYTVLGNLQQTLEKEPFTPAKVELPEEFLRYKDATDKYHEAGYDAYVTGSIFATLANHLGKKLDHPTPVVEASSKLLDPFRNKLFLMRIADIPFLNLAGPDLEPSRDHVFHLSFRKEWKSSDINNLFGAYGNVHISWINELSAFVSLYKKDNADAVMKAMGETTTLYRLVPYKVYKNSLAAAAASAESTTQSPPTSSSSSSSTPLAAASFPSPAAGASRTPVPLVPVAGISSSSSFSTPRARKRPSPVNGQEETGGWLQSDGKRQCTGDTVDTTAPGMDCEEEIPPVVPRTQLESNASKSEGQLTQERDKTDAAEADSTGMFAVPKDW